MEGCCIIMSEIEIIPTSKICNKCKEEKPIEQFRKCKTGRYQRHNFCRVCHSADSKEKYEKNKKLRLAQISYWNETNPHKTDKYNAKHREKQKKEKRKLKRELKNRPQLLDEKIIEKIEGGETPNF